MFQQNNLPFLKTGEVSDSITCINIWGQPDVFARVMQIRHIAIVIIRIMNIDPLNQNYKGRTYLTLAV